MSPFGPRLPTRALQQVGSYSGHSGCCANAVGKAARANCATIVELATKSRIPAIYLYREFVEVGGLMAYSIDLGDTYRRVANVIDKILIRGASPGDIPFYQPTKFKLIINLKTAKALGLEMPEGPLPFDGIDLLHQKPKPIQWIGAWQGDFHGLSGSAISAVEQLAD